MSIMLSLMKKLVAYCGKGLSDQTGVLDICETPLLGLEVLVGWLVIAVLP